MKRGTLLNRDLSTLVASLGHLDEIVVADAGLPVPDGVVVIDLAVSPGVPGFWDVVQALRSELIIEAAMVADEIPSELLDKMSATTAAWGRDNNKTVALSSTPHEVFKERTRNVKAIIRTGECTPYCNLVLVSGVAF